MKSRCKHKVIVPHDTLDFRTEKDVLVEHFGNYNDALEQWLRVGGFYDEVENFRKGTYELDTKELYENWDGRCSACGDIPRTPIIDHARPLRAGGCNCKENLRIVCAGCNSRNSARFWLRDNQI